MEYEITRVRNNEYSDVADVWEASVRATHHFLREEDIAYFKPLIRDDYLKAVELRCIRNKNEIVGFLGVAEQNLEMLFIHPDFRGKRIGRTLVDYAIGKMHVNKVDVNEQNEQAVGFYLHCGFSVIDRSDLDATGKPYPILHMLLKK